MSKSFFFCGCAWGCAFHIGAYKGLIKKYGYDYLKTCKFGGNSAGALIAACACLGIKWEFLEKVYLEMAKEARENGVLGKMTKYHIVLVNKLLQNENDYLKLNGRLFVGTTTFFKKQTIICQWKNNEEVKNTLHASFHVPFYCSHIKPLPNNKIGIDGGFASSFYKIDKNTVIINTGDEDSGDINCTPPLTYKECAYQLSNERYNIIRDKGESSVYKWNGSVKSNTKPITYSNKMMVAIWLARLGEHVKRRHIFILSFIYFFYYLKRKHFLKYVKKFITR